MVISGPKYPKKSVFLMAGGKNFYSVGQNRKLNWCQNTCPVMVPRWYNHNETHRFLKGRSLKVFHRN